MEFPATVGCVSLSLSWICNLSLLRLSLLLSLSLYLRLSLFESTQARTRLRGAYAPGSIEEFSLKMMFSLCGRYGLSFLLCRISIIHGVTQQQGPTNFVEFPYVPNPHKSLMVDLLSTVETRLACLAASSLYSPS
jgi:hypothetical protein